MTDPCRCRRPPFHYTDFEVEALGMDAHHADVEIQTCRHCGTGWLKYLLEDAAFTGSGRWWRVEVPEPRDPILLAATARDFIERQAEGFRGGSYFDSTGHRIVAPIRIE
jgi:hypothetical protein